MRCALCREREASTRYFRINRLTEDVETLCRPCWLAVRHAGPEEWRYFMGVGRLFLLFTILPAALLALLVGLLIAGVA